MTIKERELKDARGGHGGNERKIPTVRKDSISELKDVSGLIQMVIVTGKDNHERHFFRHTNPNGATGGFVESTASAGSEVFIDKKSTVEEEAAVTGDVRLLNGARVYGDAVVMAKEGSRITINNSEICDEVTINASQKKHILVKDSVVSGDYAYHNVSMDGETRSDRK
jgi:hypothetical protein